MKTSTTAKRLKEILDRDGLKQVDILKKAEPYCKLYDIKLTKADLSQYVSGKVEPGQEKLFILSQALDIDAAWLMGYDVEKYNHNSYMKRIMTYAHMLNNIGKAEAEKRIQELTLISTYTDSQPTPNNITYLNKSDNSPIAAHNDYAGEPSEQENMLDDIKNLKKPNQNKG